MRIFIGWFGHETNTFSRRHTDMDLLVSQGYWEGDTLLTTFRDTPSYLGGMIKCAEEKGIELIPSVGVENAGPPLTEDCLDTMVEKLLSHVKKHLGRFEGICLGLHGAGCTRTCTDIESHVLTEIRQVVGNRMPITVTLDLHGNISEGMCRLATGLFGIKENPHTDYETTGYEAMSALIRRLTEGLGFSTARVKLPLLMPITSNQDGVYREVTEYLRAYKRRHHLLDAAFFPGFPYADHPDIESSVFVTAERDPEIHAETIAGYVWSKRQGIVPEKALDAEGAVEKAMHLIKADGNRRVVINEMSDNPGGGGPGDGTHLLRAMLEMNVENSAFGYIYDPGVVRAVMDKGIGQRIRIGLGGKLEDEKFHGSPVLLEDARICSLSDGKFVATTPLMAGIPGSFGPTATLKSGNVYIIVASVANQTYDDRIFFTGGVDIRQMSLLGLKSSQHFKAFYEGVATDIIAADPIGIVTSDLSVFDYRHLTRPVYPIDPDAVFECG
ncbi:MAG: M81 family metallopeptidase [Desulfobacterales bacterium]|nr:M81 family metallopeptidase [Desulfobacterales bacterium]